MRDDRPERPEVRTAGVTPNAPYATGPMPPPGRFEYLIQCRYCGSVPAASVTYRAHRGMILIMQFRRIEGPFCRGCGLDAFRRMTSDTMIEGWWGAFSFWITPVILLMNVALRHRVAGLDPPGPAPHGYSRPSHGPGPPLFARPAAIAAMVIFGLLVLLAVLPR